MSAITIKDLSESKDLDRQAMLTIVGGARRGGRPVAFENKTASEFRLVDFPGGVFHVSLTNNASRKT